MRPTWRGAAVPLYYAGLALLASWPLFTGPYLLSLDAVFGPNMDAGPALRGATQQEGPGLLMMALVDLLSRVVTVPWATRLLFVASFFGMGYAMHVLCPAQNVVGKLFAGTVYVVNPFVYVRVVAGQWYLLPALAGLALTLHLARRVAAGEARAVVPLALALLLASVMVHVAPLALGLAVTVVAAEALAAKRLPDVRRLALAFGLWLLLSAYWLVPLLLQGNAALAAIDETDFGAFAPRSAAPTGLALDLLALHGFWRTGYEMPRDAGAPWLLWTAALLALAALGLLRGRGARAMLTVVAAAGLAGVAVAFVAGQAAEEGDVFPLAWVPGIDVYRDAQKLLVPLLLAYALLGGVGVGEAAARATHRRALAGAGAVVLALAVAGAWPLLAGYQGQLRATDYPEDWHEAKRVIEAGPPGAVLVLPWSLYMDQSWLPQDAKRVANPVPVFLDRPVLSGDDPNFAGAAQVAKDPVSAYVEAVVLPAGNATSVAHLLAPLQVSHVMLLKEDAWQERQRWLDGQPGLELVLDAERVAVYAVRVVPPRVYAPQALAGTPEDAHEVARGRPLHEVYLANDAEDAPLGALRGAKEGSTRVRPDADGVVVLAARQHEARAWTWTGKAAPPHLGFLPTGDASEGGAFVMQEHWRLRVPAYAVSILALVAMLGAHVRRAR